MKSFAERMFPEALTQGRREMLLEQLDARFGRIPETDRKRIEEGSKADYQRWAKRLLFADSLEQVFAGEPLE